MNPISLALGYIRYHVLIGHRLPSPAHQYWPASMWMILVVFAPPLYAWLFLWSASWGRS